MAHCRRISRTARQSWISTPESPSADFVTESDWSPDDLKKRPDSHWHQHADWSMVGIGGATNDETLDRLELLQSQVYLLKSARFALVIILL